MLSQINKFLNKYPILKALLVIIIIAIFGYACYMFLKDVNMFKKDVIKLETSNDVPVSNTELLINMDPKYINRQDSNWNGIRFIDTNTPPLFTPLVERIEISGGLIPPNTPVIVDVNEGMTLLKKQALQSRKSYLLSKDKNTMIFFKVKFNNQFNNANQILSGTANADIKIPDYTWNILLDNYSAVQLSDGELKVDLLRIIIYQRNKENYIRIVIGVHGNFVMKYWNISDIWKKDDYNTIGINITNNHVTLYINENNRNNYAVQTSMGYFGREYIGGPSSGGYAYKEGQSNLLSTGKENFFMEIKDDLIFSDFSIGYYQSAPYIGFECTRSWWSFWLWCRKQEFDEDEYNTNIEDYTVDLMSFYLLNTKSTIDMFNNSYEKFVQNNVISLTIQPVYTNIDLNKTDFQFKYFDINTETKRILGNSFFPFTSDIVCTNAIQNENKIYFTNIFYEQGFLNRWIGNNFDILRNKTALDIQLLGTNNSLSYLLPEITTIPNTELDDSFIKSLKESLRLENLKSLNINSNLLLFYLNILMIFVRMIEVDKSTFKKIPYCNNSNYILVSNGFSTELNVFLNTIPVENINKTRNLIYGILISWSKSQRVPLDKQFSSGTRYFDLRLSKQTESTEHFYCTTGYFECTSLTLENALKLFKNILIQYPTEYIILHFTDINLDYFNMRKILPTRNYVPITSDGYIQKILGIISTVFGDKLFNTYDIYRPLKELSSDGITLNKQVIIVFNELNNDWKQNYNWIFTKDDLNQTTGAQTTNIFSSYIQTKTQVEKFDMNSLKLSILNSHCNIKDININTDENTRNEITSTIISSMINQNILTQPKDLIELSLQFTPSYVYSCLKEPYNNYSYPLRTDGNNNYNVIVVDNIQDFNISKLIIDSTTGTLYDSTKQITNENINFPKALNNPNILQNKVIEPLPVYNSNIVSNSTIDGYIQLGNTLDKMYTDRISLNNITNFEIPSDCYLLSQNKRFMFHVGSNLTRFSQPGQYINIFDLKEQKTRRFFSQRERREFFSESLAINSLNIIATQSDLVIKVNNSTPIHDPFIVRPNTTNLIFYISNEGDIKVYGESNNLAYEYTLGTVDNILFDQEDWDRFPELLAKSTLIINYNNSYITSKAYIEGFNQTTDPIPKQLPLQNSTINIQPISIPNLIKNEIQVLNKGDEKFYLDLGNKLNDQILKYVLSNAYTPSKIETFVNTYKYILSTNINDDGGRITPIIKILNDTINRHSLNPIAVDLTNSINIMQNISWFAGQPYDMANYVETHDEALQDEIINYLNINLRQFLQGNARVVGLLQCNITSDFPNGYVGIVYDLGAPTYRTLVSFCGTLVGFSNGSQLLKQIWELFGLNAISTLAGIFYPFASFLITGMACYNAPRDTILRLIVVLGSNMLPLDNYLLRPFLNTLIFTTTITNILQTASNLGIAAISGSAKFFQKKQSIFAVIAFTFALGYQYLYSKPTIPSSVSSVQTTAKYYDEIFGPENDNTNLVKQFYNLFKSLPFSSNEIIITGHSLGGALGNIFISRLTKYFNDNKINDLNNIKITSFLIAPSPSLTIESVKEFRKSFTYDTVNHFAIGNLFNNIQVFGINLSPTYQLGIENGYIKSIEKSIPFPLFEPVLDPVFLGSSLYDKAAIISENRYGLVFENENSKNIYNIHDLQNTIDLLSEYLISNVSAKDFLQRINTEYNENVGKWNDTGKRVFYDFGRLFKNWIPENVNDALNLYKYLTNIQGIQDIQKQNKFNSPV